MAKQIKTRKGKDGFNYPYTSPDLVIDNTGKSATTRFEEIEDNQLNLIEDGTTKGIKDTEYDTLTTTDKTVIGSINELSTQFKDIANKTITTKERNKLTSLENYDDTRIKTNIQSVQQQVNNLVLGAVGDGNNAEVVQARGEYSLLDDRLNIFDKKMYDILEEEKINISLTPIADKRLSSTGSIENQSGWSIFEISVSANEIYYLNIYAYNNVNPYLVFQDTNGKVLSMLKGSESGWNLLENLKIIIPLNCTKIILSTSSSSSYISKALLVKVGKYNIKNMTKALNDINNLNNAIEDNFETLKLTWNEGKMYNRNTGIIESLNNCNCTSIDVVEGETYNIKTTGYGNANPYIILNANNSKISAYPNELISSNTTYDVTVTIPSGGTKLLINSRTNGAPLGSVSKKIGVLPLGVEELKENIIEVNKEVEFYRKNYEERIIVEQLKNDFEWKEFDKIYITFTFDDSNSDISDIETLFETKKVPCCYATVPSRLNNTTNSGEKVIDVLKRAITNGGEVLSHWYEPLTSSSTEEDYFNVYVGSKKILTEAGFDVNGIIVSGGNNYDTQDWVKGLKYARAYYRYSDLVGQRENVIQYNHRRKFLTTDDSKNKGFIDDAINSNTNQWISFASHGANDKITIDLLESLLDYISTKSNIKIVNFKYLYDTFGTTKLEKRLLALENK